MFRIDSLTKTYRGRHGTVRALDDVSLTIDRGSFVTITGSSGSGKTTLLLTLGGLIRPTSGCVAFEDTSLFGLSESRLAEYRNKRIGFVLQTFNLVPYLTALENVLVPLLFDSRKNGNASSCGTVLLERLGLGDRKEHLPRELSVGQQQRVAIARALVNSPDVILADEPTGNLDPALSREILTILKELNEAEDRTVIMVTHNPEAAKLGGKRLHLQDGRIRS